MQFNVVTLFPKLIEAYFEDGVIGRALKSEKLNINIVNPRDFATDLHGTVDDSPYGGGDGMLMMNEPLVKAMQSIRQRGYVVCMSPHGKTWCNQLAKTWSEEFESITLVCGRYAGIDQRFINEFCDEQVSVGDYVLSGGELASLTVIDSISRFLPEVLGNSQSSLRESFQDEGLLECPQFTRPQQSLGQSVPKILLSGDHQKIEKFRKQVSIAITACLRPDLFHKNKIEKPQILEALNAVSAFEDGELLSLGLSKSLLLEGSQNVECL